MSQSEDRMTEALRRLSAMAPRGAPPGLGDMLKDEFRRHHARHRRNRIAQISLIATCLAASVGLSIFLLRPRVSNIHARHELPQTAPRSKPVSSGPIEPETSHVMVASARKTRAPVKARNNPPAEADRFVTLPTFDPAIPIDHLEIVRLDLPGRALQLVGFPVSEEFAERRVVADVLLAQDGTPYALRLVRSSDTKEQWQ